MHKKTTAQYDKTIDNDITNRQDIVVGEMLHLWDSAIFRKRVKII